MINVAILIGNSDDRLTQAQWANYVNTMRHQISRHVEEIHCESLTASDSSRQSACFVVSTMNTASKSGLRSAVIQVRRQFNQDSVAWLEGKTELI